MGNGGRMTAKEQEAPHLKPPFTVNQLKKPIPPHCFQRSTLWSFWHMALDLTVASILFYMAIAFIPSLPSGAFRLVWWSIYWVTQGVMLTGVSVIAHECEHQAFADSSLLSDMVGLVLHSVLLTPYFSFMYTHRRHHSNTGSLERDQLFVPKPPSALPSYAPLLNNPVGRCISLTVALTLGLPLYFVFNVTGRQYPRFAYDPIYSDRARAQILLSDIGVASATFVLFKLGATIGFWWVVRVYGVPLLVSNGWLVFIASLQQTHLALWHYDSSEWDWLRGALATVDRDLDLLNHFFRHLHDHHLFPTILHYHAQEATRVIRPLLRDYYHMDPTPMAKECIYVEPDEGPERSKGMFWFPNKL